MYDVKRIIRAVQVVMDREGVEKAFKIRYEVVRLKHEVKKALKDGETTMSLHRLNERLQHIAKIPHLGLPKQRCNGKCRCANGIGT